MTPISPSDMQQQGTGRREVGVTGGRYALRTVHTFPGPGLSSCSVGIAGSFNSCVFHTKAVHSLARERAIRARKMEEVLVGVVGLAMVAGSLV